MKSIVSALLVAAGVALSGQAFAQQDSAIAGDEALQAGIPASASETALEYAVREGFADPADREDLPLYVREVALPDLQGGPGYSIPFCGPWSPTCPPE